jgi:hypothetical protein
MPRLFAMLDNDLGCMLSEINTFHDIVYEMGGLETVSAVRKWDECLETEMIV